MLGVVRHGRDRQRVDHVADGQLELFGERVVAIVVRGHGHDGAVAIAHEHVVGHVDGDALARHGVDRVQAGEDASLLLGGLAIDVGGVSRLLDVRAQFVGRCLRPGRAQHGVDDRMLGRDDHERGAEDGVWPRGEDAQGGRQVGVDLRIAGVDVQVEVDLGPLALADPVTLLGRGVLGPIDGVQAIEQALGVCGDAQHPLLQRLAIHRVPAALAAAVDDLLVGQHGAQLGAPVDGLLADIGQAMIVDDGALFVGGQLVPAALGARLSADGHERLGIATDVDQLAIGADAQVAALELLVQFGDGPGLVLPWIEPGVVELEEDPLRPAVEPLVDGGDLA